MYLRKITKLKNIGKFRSAAISGGEYAKFTLFYAGNGRGKTTLCAVLRSLKTGLPVYIADRRTLGEAAPPEAQLLLGSGLAVFANSKWNATADQVHIFDGTFVTENVHAGEEVSTDHRRSLYRIIVGTRGVRLAEELDALDAQVTEATAKIGAERKVLQQHAPTGFTLEKFLELPDDAEIDAKIEAQQGKLAAADQTATIASKALLKAPTIPALPSNFMGLVHKTVAGVSTDAAKCLEDHLARHKFGGDGESWVATGLAHIRDETCPFCANDLKDNQLIALYRKYFDTAYEDLKSALIALKADLERELSEASALKAQAAFKDIATEVEYWRSFGSVEYSSVACANDLANLVAPVYAEAKRVLDAKIAGPLEAIDTKPLEALLADWEVIKAGLQACNVSLAIANTGIQAIKASTAAVNKPLLLRQMAELQATKKRHDSVVAALAATYESLVTNKVELVVLKDKKKGELDAYDAAVLPKYHAAINKYLGQFGAGFSLMKSEKNYLGKVPQWMYTIEIDKHAVDITKKAGLGEPSFQTTMSAGDRSTLALAFFLAQIELDPKLADSVIVFDDPFTSLDEFRRVMTAKSIFRTGSAASQVIVLSHDKHFLKDVHDKIVGVQCSTLQISSTKQNSCIEPWDLKREVKEGYLQDHMDMQDFHDGHAGDAKAMRTLMRPLLEKYIRYRFPNQIPDGKWLGDMLGIIAADPNHPLTGVYQEIDDINQYTAPFHHDPNTAFEPDEVRTFVARTLAVVGGC